MDDSALDDSRHFGYTVSLWNNFVENRLFRRAVEMEVLVAASRLSDARAKWDSKDEREEDLRRTVRKSIPYVRNVKNTDDVSERRARLVQTFMDRYHASIKNLEAEQSGESTE